MASSLQKKIYYDLHPDHRDTGIERATDNFIIILILLNVVVVSLETVEPIYQEYKQFFHYFDLFTVIVFSLEYLLRLWSCTADPRYAHPVFGRLKFMFSFAALVDLLAILPFYLPFFFDVDLRFIRVLSLFRFLKMGRYFKAAKIFSAVLRDKKNELFLSLMFMLVLIVLSSSLMYFLERDAQPKAFSSIPASLWWGVTTLTTLGYGDVRPVTMPGKIVTGICLITAIAMFAVPAGILASGFTEAFKKRKNKELCPHCGLPVNEVS